MHDVCARRGRTVKTALPARRCVATEMLATPSPNDWTLPALSILATFALLDCHVSGANPSSITFPRASVMVAFKSRVDPSIVNAVSTGASAIRPWPSPLRAPRQRTVAHRTGLPRTQRRTRPRSFRGTFVARLTPSHHVGLDGLRVFGVRNAARKKTAAMTLPAVRRALQALLIRLGAWCPTCHRTWDDSSSLNLVVLGKLCKIS